MRARYYDPTIGRFISEDSEWGKDSDPLSLNLYTYCGNDPIDRFDPSGHDFINPNTGLIYDTNTHQYLKPTKGTGKTTTSQSKGEKNSDTFVNILVSTVTSAVNSKTLANYLDKSTKKIVEMAGEYTPKSIKISPQIVGYLGKGLTGISVLSNINDLRTETSPWKLTCTYGSLAANGAPPPFNAITDVGMTVVKELYKYQSKETQNGLDAGALEVWKSVIMSGTSIAK